MKLTTNKYYEWWVEMFKEYGFDIHISVLKAKTFCNKKDIVTLHQRIIKLEKLVKSLKKS